MPKVLDKTQTAAGEKEGVPQLKPISVVELTPEEIRKRVNDSTFTDNEFIEALGVADPDKVPVSLLVGTGYATQALGKTGKQGEAEQLLDNTIEKFKKAGGQEDKLEVISSYRKNFLHS